MPNTPTLVTFRGETRSLTDWSKRLSIPLSTIMSRIKAGWPAERVLGQPVEKKFRPIRNDHEPMLPPKLNFHKGTGQARIQVSIDGRSFARYFGKWNSRQADIEYRKFVEKWKSVGPLAALGVEVMLISELIVQYLEWVEIEYRKRGRPSSERYGQRSAMRVLNQLHGPMAVDEFTPDMLRGYQKECASRGWRRNTVRSYTNRVMQLFRFGVEHGHVASEQLDRLRAGKLRRVTSPGKRSEKKKPVAWSDIEATFPHLHQNEQVRSMLVDMIRLQVLIGLRPGEICVMRWKDIDRDCGVGGGVGSEWKYTIAEEWAKKEHMDIVEEHWIGPKGQEILSKYLDRSPDEYLFRLPNKSTHVDRSWYGRCIKKACKLAGIEVWNPHRLRHTRATEILLQTGSYRDAGRAIGDSEEVARRHYADGEEIKRRIAKEFG